MNEKWPGHADPKSASMSERLDLLLEHNPAVVYTCNLGRPWAFSYISPNVQRILGFEARELLVDPGLWRSRIHPDDMAHVPQRGITGLLIDDTRVFEYRFRHRDGNYRWLRDELRLLPERDPVREPFECTGYCVDVTARKRAESLLEESEARFAAFMYNSPAAAFMKDEDGRLVFVNPAFLRLTGLEGVEWRGKTDLDLWPPQLARQIRASDLEILSTGLPKAVEEVIPGASGQRVLFMLKFPFRDGAGRVFLAGMGIDNTERRILEESLVRGGGLSRLIRESSAELPAVGQPAAPLADVPGGNETVLLVEDEQLVRDLASRVLGQQGYRVIEAESGGEALRLIEERDVQFDVLVTDVVMPGLGGQELAERLRARQPALRVVFISGYHDERIFDRSRLTSADLFVNKPFSPQDLLRTVRKVLDQPGA